MNLATIFELTPAWIALAIFLYLVTKPRKEGNDDER